MTPREFVASLTPEKLDSPAYQGTIWLDRKHMIASYPESAARTADAPEDACGPTVVVVASEADWDAPVSGSIRGVWQPLLPVPGEGEFLVVTRIEEECGVFCRPQASRLYEAAQAVFMSLPPAGYWQGDVVSQVAALRAWVSRWDPEGPFGGPHWMVDSAGHWILTSETSGRQFHLRPGSFTIAFGASIVAAADVIKRLAAKEKRTWLTSRIEVTVAVGRYDDNERDIVVVPGNEMPWQATLGQLARALKAAGRARDLAQYGPTAEEPPVDGEPANEDEADDEAVDLTDVFVPESDLNADERTCDC
jgi:hypothetical protein